MTESVMTPLVSIIITNYSYGAYLAEAIESALAQTFPDCEVLVIDDSSTDNSLEVAARYPVKVLLQDNSGVCVARNNALSVATGRYVLFLDADDRLVPTAVEHMLAVLQGQPDTLAYVYGQMRYFGRKEGVFASMPFDGGKLGRANFICASTLIRRDILVSVGGYDDGFRMLREDWELYIRLFTKGYHGRFLPEVVLEYRKHKEPTGNTTRQIKTLSVAKLFYLYPSLTWRLFIRHPLRYGVRMMTARVWESVGNYGPKPELSGLRVIQDANRD
jgi:glycosyltransferase involved in cell wall biosynthesis